MDWKEIIICAITLLIGGVVALQFKSFKQWLIYACSEAEKYFGSGSGQLKLRYVYNMAIESKIGFITKIITFNMFSKFVDAALVKMRIMIESSDVITSILQGSKIIDVVDVVDEANGNITDNTNTTVKN